MVKSLFQKHEKILTLLAVAAGLTGLLLNFDFSMLEAKLYDLRVAHGSQLKADPNIVLVTLDDLTTQNLGELAPLTLDFHARFLEELERLTPKGVGYLVDLNQVNQANPELFNSEWSQRFLRAAHRLEAQGAPVILGNSFDIRGEVLPPYPLSSLPNSVAIIHKDGNVFGEDKITRRSLLELNGKPVFHLSLARALGWIGKREEIAGSFSVPEIDGKYFFFRYHGNTAKKSYLRVSFRDVLKGTLPAGFFQNKAVLVGSLSKENSTDFAFTPYSNVSFTNPKLVLHANILDSIANDQSVYRLPEWVNGSMTFAVSLFVLYWVLNTTPLYGLFATVSLTVLYIGVCHLLYQIDGIWVREAHPILGIFLGYYLAVPFRLIREYRKRWAYQRKNELLTQVEELKTNFLNLVTHDLKTPVARIQGLAEVLLRKADLRLIDRDKETLHHIISSTDELNRFISSILELSKVESNNLHIRIESKDINQLIERSVDSFKASAKAKQIKIQMQLEPLFPIKIDTTLISKVINNLIDNAIKYSPKGSNIGVETREIDSWIVISITDEGIGMTSAEQENLFTRFYRAKNDATAETSGTGLGLYLTRYFVEAHQGRVEVVSEKGKGSTFKIILPLEFTGVQVRRSETAPGLVRRIQAMIKKEEKAHV